MKLKVFVVFILCLFVFAENSFAQSKRSNDTLAEKFTDAAGNGDIEEIQSMLKNGIDINIEPSGHKGWTALMSASTSGQTKVVEYLLSKGANVKVKLNDGKTTLIQSAQSDDNEKIVKMLIKAGVEIDAQTNTGLTALMRFAWMSQSEAVKLVLDAGANTKIKNKNGWTAFYFACSHGNDVKIVKYLLDAGANPNERNAQGETPLMWLGWGNRAENFKALIAAGADVNAKNNEGKTPLIISSARFFYDEIKLLLDAKADVKARDKNGWNALMFASSSRFRSGEIGAHGDGMIVWLSATKILEELIAAGIDVNEQNNNGETALILAIKAGNAHFAETLLAKGANSAIKDKKGKTADDYADQDYKKMKESLLKIYNNNKRQM